MTTRVIGTPGSRKRARLVATGMALQPAAVKLTPRPAFVERWRAHQIRAVAGAVLQLWVQGSVRKFERPCKLCRATVRIGERCWRPDDQRAVNRADRVCYRCWPREAEKGKEHVETVDGGGDRRATR